ERCLHAQRAEILFFGAAARDCHQQHPESLFIKKSSARWSTTPSHARRHLRVIRVLRAKICCSYLRLLNKQSRRSDTQSKKYRSFSVAPCTPCIPWPSEEWRPPPVAGRPPSTAPVRTTSHALPRTPPYSTPPLSH